jgi:hypothetical protein
MSETQAVLTLWGAVLGGVLLGFLAGWLRGMRWGIAIGCLVIGAGASTAAMSLAWQRWQFIAHAEHVQGTLTGQRNGPFVQFRSADGALHEVHGLGGSQSNTETGQAVPVHYLGSDPAQAVVADFQNLWGGVLAFTLFGALPLAFGAFFLALAIDEARPKRRSDPGRAPDVFERLHGQPPPLAAWRERLSGNLVICANFTMLVGVGFALFLNDSIPEFGRAFLVIGIAAALFGLAFVFKRAGGWMAPAIAFIVALGFVLFGGGAMLLA